MTNRAQTSGVVYLPCTGNGGQIRISSPFELSHKSKSVKAGEWE